MEKTILLIDDEEDLRFWISSEAEVEAMNAGFVHKPGEIMEIAEMLKEKFNLAA